LLEYYQAKQIFLKLF